MTATDQRLRCHERLHDPREFRRVYDHRCSVANAHVVIYGRANGRARGRIGLSVSRRLARRAVVRSRLRRALREAYRRTKADWPAGIDWILIPRTADLPPLATLIGTLPLLARRLAGKLDRARGRRP